MIKSSNKIIKVFFAVCLLALSTVLAACGAGGSVVTPTAVVDSKDKPTASPTPSSGPVSTAEPTATGTPTAATPTPMPAAQAGAFSIYGSADEIPEVSCKSFIITDEKGRIVLSNNATDRILPASTIKMLTAITAIDIWTEDKLMEVTSRDLAYNGAASVYGLKDGMKIDFESLMNMLLIQSCGDAATVIAGNCARELTQNPNVSVREFVYAMNQKAHELGMNDTYVDNPIGLDINDGYKEIHTTAADMMKLLRAFMANKQLAGYVAKKSYAVPDLMNADGTVTKGKNVISTNYFYTQPKTYHSDMFEVIGTKTGGTKNAGDCFASTVVSLSGRTYYCCLFGEKVRADMFLDTIKLLEYCIENE